METPSKQVTRRRFLSLTSLMTLTTLSTGNRALAGSTTRTFRIRVTSESRSDISVSGLSDRFDNLTKGILLKHRYPEAIYDLQSDRSLRLHVREPVSDTGVERLVHRDLSFGKEEVHYLYAEALRDAVRLAPEEPYLVRALGDYYLSFRRYKEGVADFRDMLADLPDQPLLLFQLGMLYARTNRKQDAYDVFRQVHQLDPNDSVTMYNLGTFAADLGDYKEAERWFTAALSHDPNMHDARKQLERLNRRVNRKVFTLT